MGPLRLKYTSFLPSLWPLTSTTSSLTIQNLAALIGSGTIHPILTLARHLSGDDLPQAQQDSQARENDEEKGLIYHGSAVKCPLLSRWTYL
ncbi:hypothetical protein B0H12DRAFT_1123362 [Mycena haematopus]|nr:hypothetical protein B0H12DRAFT_1123362 [Mycena haematopus]